MKDNLEFMSIPLPEQKNFEYAYSLAFELARDKLADVIDIKEQCVRSGSQYIILENKPAIILEYLGDSYKISLPQVEITFSDGRDDVVLRDKILILHYLTRATGISLSKNLITYQELKEGATYYPSFYKRAVKPFIEHFGRYPQELPEASKIFRGYISEFGDISVTIPAFSCVPVTLVLWKGDEEFPPNGNILFDSTILDYLSAEDINILCQTIVWKLIKHSQKLKNF